MFRTAQILVLPLLLLFLFLGGCAPPGGAIERAAQKKRQAAATGQNLAAADLQRAADYLKNKDYQRAKTAYGKLFSAGEQLPAEANYRYGYTLNRTGDYAAAIEQFSIYTKKVGSDRGFHAEAMQEWSFAQTELGNLTAQANREAEQQARQAAISAALASALPLPEAQAEGVRTARLQLEPTIVEPLTGLELLLVKGGCYQMGDSFGDADELEKRHEVCVADFYLGKHEVTQGQWQRLMGFNPASQQGENYPLETISWLEAQAFLQRLNGAGENFRLPTEAEWEYAARSGGQKERFSGSDDAGLVAWYQENSGGRSHPVGQKQPNGLGLYDMSGNVAEWCQDYFTSGYYQISPRDNPTGAASPSRPGYRMIRGGSFGSDLLGIRSSHRRTRHEAQERDRELGFRVALPVSLQQ